MNAPPLSLLSDGEGFAISMIVTMLLSVTFIGMPVFCIVRNVIRSNRETEAPPEEVTEEEKRGR